MFVVILPVAVNGCSSNPVTPVAVPLLALGGVATTNFSPPDLTLEKTMKPYYRGVKKGLDFIGFLLILAMFILAGSVFVG